MNAIRLTAAVGVIALFTSAAHAQGLIPQFFNGSQDRYSTGYNNGLFNSSGNCSNGICGPNGCYAPGTTTPTYQGVNRPVQPFPLMGSSYGRDDRNHPGYQLPGNHFWGSNGNGQYGVGRPQMNFPNSNSGLQNRQPGRVDRTPESGFHGLPGARPEQNWQFNNPDFSRVNHSSTPAWNLLGQQNGWTMH